MKFKRGDRTKFFTKVVHYTNGEGASNIMKYGFDDKLVSRIEGPRPFGMSFFEDCDDYIKNNNKDLYELSNRFRHNLKTKGQKWFQGNNDEKTGKIKIDDDFYNSFIHQSNLGWLETKHKYKQNDKLDKSEFIDQFRKLPKLKNPKYPIEDAQTAHMSSAVWRNKDKTIYRITADTKNDKDLYTVTGLLETRVPVSNIDNKSLKVEIPSDMVKNKDMLDRYSKEYKKFDEKDFDKTDGYTKKSVDKIKENIK